ncbi:MAG TPA: glycosyltransferase family 2 protein [Terriglobales bacterium]|nr:glycosyltransferase family 2 protein [Terriglobales bacterium]
MASVCVVIAAYNEAPVIGAVVARALAALPEGEVLVVDDGSTDGTDRAAAAAGARTIRLPDNIGKGGAIRCGLREARAEVVVLIDGDGQDDPGEIPQLLAALQPGVDLVVGSRFLGHFEPGAITPLNHWGNRFLTGVINTLFGAQLTDTQAGFKAIRAEMLRRITLSAHYFDIEVDLLLAVLSAGGRVVEIPVNRAPRQHSQSRLHSFIDGSRILLRILRRRFGV